MSRMSRRCDSFVGATLLLSLLGGACGKPATKASVHAKPASTEMPPAVSGTLVDASTDGLDARVLRYVGEAVPVEKLPIVAEAIGLPVSGLADVRIDVNLPKSGGVADYSKANGTIELRCRACRVGDDSARLQPRVTSKSASTFVGEGIEFGHVDIAAFEARMTIVDGKLETREWKLESADLELRARVTGTLTQDVTASTIDGCVAFRPTPELARRDGRTHAVLQLIGGALDSDDLLKIQLAGTLGEPRLLARPCEAKL